ncbi:MAG: helix-turn-helix transcriptional regulator [Clostridia bacterium]|nr:helix-turn-helix transcriptional regulator [Clostridia bacterium]
MALSADLLRGYTDTILLCQLSGGDSYGYEINKRIAEISHGSFELKEATLYTAFRRMETAGLIISYWGTEGSGARRRYYAITPAGRDRMYEDLMAWGETKKTLSALLTEVRAKEPDLEEVPVIRVAQEEAKA